MRAIGGDAMIEHMCSFDEDTCQVLNAEGDPIVFDPTCAACRAEQAGPQLLEACRAADGVLNLPLSVHRLIRDAIKEATKP